MFDRPFQDYVSSFSIVEVRMTWQACAFLKASALKNRGLNASSEFREPSLLETRVPLFLELAERIYSEPVLRTLRFQLLARRLERMRPLWAHLQRLLPIFSRNSEALPG